MDGTESRKLGQDIPILLDLLHFQLHCIITVQDCTSDL